MKYYVVDINGFEFEWYLNCSPIIDIELFHEYEIYEEPIYRYLTSRPEKYIDKEKYDIINYEFILSTGDTRSVYVLFKKKNAE